ncbi:MAG: hypothetical protein KKC76_03280 [Proteobacteria bacterium]|nr:hypothetical protein [Pseudomonadota bacterium]MBU4295730.1 hypothetical protein [Pseudomonadota bacterium]MCG2747149.1 hypothetical protein [Desulfobulbaceae bacterium]
MNKLSSAKTILPLLLALAALFSTVPAVSAGAGTEIELIEEARQLFARINEARGNPRAVMSRLGIAESTARAALGENGWIVDQGLPPLVWQDQLMISALRHGRDMFANLYYSNISKDGHTPRTRIVDTGYAPLKTGEALTALAFSGYLATEDALPIMLDNLLYDELTASPEARRKIFSPVFSEAGLTLLAGSIPLFAGQPHVYMFVADFGLPEDPNNFDLHDQAWLLWQRINEARGNPRAAMARLGVSETTAFAALGKDAWILDQGLSPLAWSDLLHASSFSQANRLRANYAEPAEYQAAEAPEDRIDATGYEADLVDEIIEVKLCSHDESGDIDSALADMVDILLRDELSGLRSRKLFSPFLTEIAISAMEISEALHTGPNLFDPAWPDVYLLSMDLASPITPREFVVGRADAGDFVILTDDETGLRQDYALLPGNSFQFAAPAGVYSLVSLDGKGNELSDPVVIATDSGRNSYVVLHKDR